MIDKIRLGIVLAATMGPVSIEMVKRGLQHGFISAFSVRIGGAIANTLCLILAFLGLSIFGQNTFMLKILGVFGIMLLFYLGIKGIIEFTKHKEYNFIPNRGSKINSIKIGFFLAILSPVGIAFWLGTFALNFVNDVKIYNNNIEIFLANSFIIVGVLLWGLVFSGIIVITKKVVTTTLLRMFDLLASLSMLFYACKSLYMLF